MKLVRAFLLLLLVAVAAGAAYAYFTPGALDFLQPAKAITDEEAVNATAIAFVGSPYKDGYGTTRVPGYVDNQTKSELRAVTLQIQMLDDQGNKKQKVTHILKDVPPSSRKTFDINLGTGPADLTPSVKVLKVEVVQR